MQNDLELTREETKIAKGGGYNINDVPPFIFIQ